MLKRGFGRKVRNAMGLSTHKVTVCGSTLFSQLPANQLNHQAIFRIASGWHNTREDFARLLIGFLSATQMTDNVPLFTDGKCRWTADLLNPTNNPLRVELVCMTLKNEAPIVGTWLGTAADLPFAATSANNNGNSPTNSFWEFFNQDPRAAASAAGIGAVAAFTDMPTQTYNVQGNYLAPASGQEWEITATAPNQDPFYRTFWRRLTDYFPKLQRKLKLRTVFRGTIPALGGRKANWSTRMPAVIKPYEISSDQYPLFRKGVSHFYFIRALGPRPIGKVTTSAVANTSYNDYWDVAYRLLPQIIVTYKRTYRCKTAQEKNANVPTEAVASDYTAAGTNGWINATAGAPYWGWRWDAEGTRLTVADVTSFRVKKPYDISTPAISGGSMNAAGTYQVHQ